MSALFKIGSVDYTMYIPVPKYSVNIIPKFKEWTDVNYTLHRAKTRYKVEGKFTLKFRSVEEYRSFIARLKEHTVDDGSTTATLYCNNTLATKQGQFFFDFEPSNSLPVIGMQEDEGFEVTVTER